tara:strand:+ start:1600 stop:2040 length:441 start_codon:yes stop_codon:yes gene_type:complete
MFSCVRCEGELVVPTHNPEPDGVRRDQLSCTKEGKLGLTKMEGADHPTTISSPQLRHSVSGGTCKHTTCMHSPEIIAQLPGAHSAPHRTALPAPRCPHRTAPTPPCTAPRRPHRTAPYRTAPPCTTPGALLARPLCAPRGPVRPFL